ncbi:MAG: MFS transporter [Gammaproteobacteria bacterium]|nr:MFS transporter [Gammaproteobacteria bacterium]
MSAEPTRPIYYGWKIVIAVFILLTCMNGVSFYNQAIYLNALSEDSGFDVQTASFAVSLFFLSGGLTGLLVARWVRDYDPRFSISAGSVLTAVGLCALPYIESLWQLYGVYIILGMGFSAAGLIPATTLITRWFKRRRALALSIATTGLSAGGVVVTPLSVLLIDSLGFTLATPLLGFLFLAVVVPVSHALLRPSPASLGMRVDGESESEAHQAKTVSGGEVEEQGISYRQAIHGRFFWGVSIAYFFLMLAQVGGITHQYGLAREQLSESATALAIAILPIASMTGRLMGGWILDTISIRLFSIIIMIIQTASLALLAGGFSVITLCTGLFLFGATVGNILMLQPLLIAEAYGVTDYARIYSLSNLMTSLGTAIGPALLGFAYAASANLYAVPYMVAALAGGLGLLLFLGGGSMHHAKVDRTQKPLTYQDDYR